MDKTSNDDTWSFGARAAPGSREDKSRSRRRWLRRVVGVAAVAGVAGVVAAAVWPEPVPVDLAPARRASMQVTLEETGRARVRDRYVVSAPFAGSVGRSSLRAGDWVQEGQTVATLVPAEPPLLDPRARASAEARVASAGAVHRQAQATARRAELALEEARREHGNTRTLAAVGATTTEAVVRAQAESRMREEELASTRFATQVAASEIAAARAALGILEPRGRRVEAFEVPAPVSGRILRVLHSDAGVVAPGAPLLEIGDPAALEVVVDVLTVDAARVVPGAKATLLAWGGAPLDAHVRRVEPSAFTRVSALGVEEQRVNVVVDLDAPRSAWEALGDGWRVEAKIVLWAKDDTLVISSGAVFRRDDAWATFVVAGGRAHLRSVRLGQRNGTEVEILEGLGEGERLVVHPSDAVADGVRVGAR